MEIQLREEQILKHKGKMVKHFKGKYYLILDFAKHTETGEVLVIYKALYGGCGVFARPLNMFAESVDKEKYPDVKQQYRFELIIDSE